MLLGNFSVTIESRAVTDVVSTGTNPRDFCLSFSTGTFFKQCVYTAKPGLSKVLKGLLVHLRAKS